MPKEIRKMKNQAKQKLQQKETRKIVNNKVVLENRNKNSTIPLDLKLL